MAVRTEDVVTNVIPSVAAVANVGVPDENGSVWLPLNTLKKSPKNVRRVPHTPQHITELAAMIDAEGQLYPCIVDREAFERGENLVTAGEGRRLAQDLRASNGKIAVDEPIWCKLGAGDRAVEISLADNKQQPMHPADEFEAFRALIEQGRSIEYIAAYRGINPVEVRRRLKLANVAPEFIEMFRAGELEIDHMMAFALTEDHEQQRAVWSAIPKHSRPPHSEWIRDALVRDELPLTSALAKFVGVTAYEKAGGFVRRDLFRDDDHGYIMDVPLLTKLATEKLEKAAGKLKKQGCAWVEPRFKLDYSELQSFGRVDKAMRDCTDDENAKLASLAQEVEQLQAEISALSEGDERLPALRERAQALQTEVETIDAGRLQPVPEQQRIAGAIVTIDQNGKLRIERDLLKPADKKRIAKETKAASKAGDEGGEQGEKNSKPKDREHSAAHLLSLSAHRTLALQAVLIDRPDVALVALTHRLLMKTFSSYLGSDSAVEITAAHRDLEPFANDIKQAKAYKVLEERRATLKKQLPRKADNLFAWLLKQPQSEVLQLLAFCVAATVDSVRNDETFGGASGELAKAVGLNMREWWTATAANYFGRIPKERVISIVTKALSPESAAALHSLKKQGAAQLAEERMANTGWLPKSLRTPEG
ncbi:MAG: ParB N-terminal domain-containing protein [Pseudomonadota bacterium]|nr:ParB N-terminal domain-containing protein [Pseudomonadota bacterium]